MKKIVYLVFLILLSSCLSYNRKDFDFNAEDLNHLLSFRIGDTVYFENQNGDQDTILLKGYEADAKAEPGGIMALPACNSVWVSIEHLPIDYWAGITRNGDDTVDINHQTFFVMSKNPQEKEIEFLIQFRNFFSHGNNTIGEFHSDTIVINGKRINDYYILQNTFPEQVYSGREIDTVYWTDKYGIAAYKSENWYTNRRLPQMR